MLYSKVYGKMAKLRRYKKPYNFMTPSKLVYATKRSWDKKNISRDLVNYWRYSALVEGPSTILYGQHVGVYKIKMR